MEKLPKINIIYEDNHIIVVEKPVNIPVQSDNSKDISLQELIKDYLKEKYHKPGNVYLGIVHRLDRPVGGIMIFAKTSKAASRLSKQIQDNIFKKIYYAVTEGKVKEYDKLIDYLIKDPKTNISRITTKDKGKKAILEYTLINKKDKLSLVKINLETGRSHQIRVQMANIGAPLVGDMKYGYGKEKINVALFAKKIIFYHPISKELIEFELPLPNRYPFKIFK